jgi:acyl-coenzyme A synthetase/AMP-(fatty) acid ligase
MEYSLNVKRLRMKAVVDSIDGGNGNGKIELRNAEGLVLASLLLQKPSFYLVGDDLHLCAPTTGYVTVVGTAFIGTISDGTGTLVIDAMTVGTDQTEDAIHDYEINLDTTMLEIGNQVTIVSATIEHG